MRIFAFNGTQQINTMAMVELCCPTCRAGVGTADTKTDKHTYYSTNSKGEVQCDCCGSNKDMQFLSYWPCVVYAIFILAYVYIILLE